MENGKLYTCRALIIDDNEINTIVLSNMLKLFLIDVDQVSSGAEALQKLCHTEYDLIFVDHIMPKMNGAQTTKAIRQANNNKNSIIIILTSSLTDEIRYHYQYAGANDIYTKPLGLSELGKIIQLWCPQLSIETSSLASPTAGDDVVDSLISSLIDEIKEIQYEVGLKYALGDAKHYIEILSVSLKDIRTCMKLIKDGSSRNRLDDSRIGVHNIKNIFANIGALTLAERSKEFEQVALHLDQPAFDICCSAYVNRINDFCEKLDSALHKYKSKAKEIAERSKDTLIPMTNEEYEQCINNTIYYIKRYDYVAILNELERLIRQEYTAHQYELEQAIAEIKDYKYESILIRMTKLKEEMDGSKASVEGKNDKKRKAEAFQGDRAL